MFRSFEFCIPTKSTSVPTGPDWLQDVKYDGYRLAESRAAARTVIEEKYLAAPTVIGVIIGR